MYHTSLEKIDKILIKSGNIDLLMKNRIIKYGADLLRKGEVVAFPTETVYGLGADATREGAVEKIFVAKGRPQDNPLIVHIGSFEQLSGLIDGKLPTYVEKLLKRYWPGPLTIVTKKSKTLPMMTTAGLDTVAIRMPDHPVARALILASNLPIAAPSANLSGSPSPTRADHVYADLNKKIPLIIDGGPTKIGLESTVVDVRDDKPVILRPGGLSREEISSFLGFEVQLAENIKKPLSPGIKYRHYSPETPLTLIKNINDKLLNQLIEDYKGKRLAFVLTSESIDRISNKSGIEIIEIGSRFNPELIANRLFALLRKLDKKDFDQIFIEAIPEKGIGEAVMNRIYKAVRKNVLELN